MSLAPTTQFSSVAALPPDVRKGFALPLPQARVLGGAVRWGGAATHLGRRAAASMSADEWMDFP